MVTVTLYSAQKESSLPIDDWKRLGATDRQIKALVYIQQSGSISRKEYAQIAGVSPSSAYRDLTDLVQRGIHVSIGIGSQLRYGFA